MQCPTCGGEAQEGRFCTLCGATLPLSSPTPQEPTPTQPVAQQPAPSVPVPQQEHPPPAFQQPPSAPPGATPYVAHPPELPPKKKRSCGKGCSIGCLVVILLGLVMCAWVTNVPERLGITRPVAEREFELAPDRLAAEDLMDVFAEQGQSSGGVMIHVFPLEESGEDRQLAYVLLDESSGFAFIDDADAVPVRDHLIWVAESEVADYAFIVRVAVEYVDEAGDSVLAITAPTDVIRQYADGTITEDEFFRLADGRLDMDDMLGLGTGWLQ